MNKRTKIALRTKIHLAIVGLLALAGIFYAGNPRSTFRRPQIRRSALIVPRKKMARRRASACWILACQRRKFRINLNARDEFILSRAFSLGHHPNFWIAALLIRVLTSPSAGCRRDAI